MSTTKRLRVAVLGPKGQCGSCVVDELLSRGHSVVGLSRNPPREWQTSGDYKAESVDFNSINELSAALSRGYDAIVCAFMTSHDAKGLITGSRVALHLWEGVTEKSWSFLSPPWLLRDKGIRTGKYEVYVDELDSPGYQAIYGGIYNEDMAVAIVDEVENNKLAYKHWSCVGPIGLGKW
ncbi:hypothetical protein K4K54_004909 [Colletotrichum sp. SAR 10_86]|nr:hypothetical protein K4K54_004909 [Colletotrichum sp. SAR 10_86]KAJ5003369.1 hypothetical protein K4K48_011970 [Colletotrichum sp. SAR 10_66]